MKIVENNSNKIHTYEITMYPDIVVVMFCDISNTEKYRLYLKAGLSVCYCVGDFQNAIIYFY